MQISSLVSRWANMLITYCSSLVKTNLISLQEQLELSMRNGTGFNPTQQLLTTINEDLEALESIYQCGLSQERISNDVLSLGRIQLGMSFPLFSCFQLISRYVAWVFNVISDDMKLIKQRYTTSMWIYSMKLRKWFPFSRMKREWRGLAWIWWLENRSTD